MSEYSPGLSFPGVSHLKGEVLGPLLVSYLRDRDLSVPESGRRTGESLPEGSRAGVRPESSESEDGARVLRSRRVIRRSD